MKSGTKQKQLYYVISEVIYFAVCWSPKGKQLVVGKMDGSFTNYDQLLQRKKEISAPTLFQPNTMTCELMTNFE